jgi:hypothetical protein
VSLLGIERKDLPCYLAVGHSERSDGFRPKATHGFEAMPAVRSPESGPWGKNCDNRIEKTPSLVDNVS